MAHILIKTSGIRTELFIDGKKVDGMRKITFEKKAGEVPVVCVDLKATDMEIDGELIPELPEVFKPFYILKETSEDDLDMNQNRKEVVLTTELKKPESVTYDLKFVQEIMHFLEGVNTDKSNKLLQRMICPNPRKPLSEEEATIRCMTHRERVAALYGSSLPKDSETLKTLKMLCESTKSEN